VIKTWNTRKQYDKTRTNVKHGSQNTTWVMHRASIALLTPMLNHFSRLILLKWRLCTSSLLYCLRVFHVCTSFVVLFARVSRFNHVFTLWFQFWSRFSCSFNFRHLRRIRREKWFNIGVNSAMLARCITHVVFCDRIET
jgi:hypothetical protein